jgi:hypothetical protein
MQRRQFLAATFANAAAIATLSGCGGGGVAAVHFRLIATDDKSLSIRNGPVIADDGTVAFAAVSFGKSSVIVFGDGESMTRQAVGGARNSNISHLAICSAGDIVYAEHYPTSSSYPRLQYSHMRLDTRATLFEGPISTVRMSSNGTVAAHLYSDDTFFRGPAAGPLSLLEPMRGEYLQTRDGYHSYDVNDAGEVVAHVGYIDGHAREGVLVLDEPGAPVSSLRAVLQRVGVSPESVAINNHGQVAFALNETALVYYFNPPFPTRLSVESATSSQLFLPGVYVATPAPIGMPVRFNRIASQRAGYSDFAFVDINDEGTVVFRARVGARPGVVPGTAGLFRGGDPIADLIVFDGQVLVVDGTAHVMREPYVPQLNNANQLAFRTGRPESGFSIWRVYLPPRV